MAFSPCDSCLTLVRVVPTAEPQPAVLSDRSLRHRPLPSRLQSRTYALLSSPGRFILSPADNRRCRAAPAFGVLRGPAHRRGRAVRRDGDRPVGPVGLDRQQLDPSRDGVAPVSVHCCLATSVGPRQPEACCHQLGEAAAGVPRGRRHATHLRLLGRHATRSETAAAAAGREPAVGDDEK